MNIKDYYKYDDIKEYFDDWLKERYESNEDWINENLDDLHHYAFNEDYYIIGRYQAKEWLSDEVFNVINIIKEYENMHFGEVNTDFSEPESVVNMYVYIVGEYIVNDYIESLEVKSA
jgi:hypothetical protein|tara:strand:- start:367 stop:717 length:351 start_codon:yes stop_codon:yes gene_type:complete